MCALASVEARFLEIARSERLIIRRMTLDDAAFIYRLVNEPSWLENIGDRNVHSLEDAECFIRGKVLAFYESHGFGMYVVESNATGETVGVCGIVLRDSLPGPDLGFALLPEFWGQGFALEAATAVMHYAHDVLQLPPLLAITVRGNTRSFRLLEKLGFEYQHLVRLTPDGEELKLYAAPPCPSGQKIQN